MPNVLNKKKITASGLIYSGPCVYGGFRLGMDGVNDQTVTIFDNTSASGEEVEPTSTYDASALGANGANMGVVVECGTGLYGEISGSGSREVTVYYQELKKWERSLLNG